MRMGWSWRISLTECLLGVAAGLRSGVGIRPQEAQADLRSDAFRLRAGLLEEWADYTRRPVSRLNRWTSPGVMAKWRVSPVFTWALPGRRARRGSPLEARRAW